MTKRKRPEDKKKPGRKTDFKESYIEEAEKLARLGLPQKQMAWYWGVSEDTITNWKKAYPEFSDALKRGQSNRNISILQAAYENAIKNKNVAMQIFLLKNWLGFRDIVDVVPTEDTTYVLSDKFLPRAAEKKNGGDKSK